MKLVFFSTNGSAVRKEEVGRGHLCRYDNYVRNREKFTGGKQRYFPFLRLRAKAIN